MSKIYNKNAREKALLEEAYTGVYKESAVDVELESWWEYDPHDVVVKVYHGALHAMPPAEGTPEYERNFEKIFDWLEGKYPQRTEEVDAKKYQPRRARTSADATEWANRVARDPESRFYDPEHGEDAEMEFDERGFAKNTEAGREGEGSGFKVGDWVYDDEGAHASIVHIDGDEVALYDGKEGWTVRQSDISHEQRDHDDDKYSRSPSNYPGQPGAQY